MCVYCNALFSFHFQKQSSLPVMDAAFAAVGPEIEAELLRPSPTSPTCAYSPSPSGPSVQPFESQAREGNCRDRC